MSALQHPNSHAPASRWSESQTLHVAAAYSNPFRWRTRRQLANDFRQHMKQSANVELHFLELAYGDRPFEVTGDHENDLQLRTSHELFHKENLLNLAVASFPDGWQCGAVIDADFLFTRHDWALEAIHQLQHYDWVQLFSTYSDLSGSTPGDGHLPIRTSQGFMATYRMNGNQLPITYTGSGRLAAHSAADDRSPVASDGGRPRPRGGVSATGGAWAFRRAAFDATGGLMDRCILGSGDWFMAFGLVSTGTEPELDYRDLRGYSQNYWNYIRAWQQRAAGLRQNIGYVDCHAIHHFHGPKNLRGYGSRDSILVENQFDPYTDVFPDSRGVLQLTPLKPRLRDDIRSYFLSRSEDVPHLED